LKAKRRRVALKIRLNNTAFPRGFRAETTVLRVKTASARRRRVAQKLLAPRPNNDSHLTVRLCRGPQEAYGTAGGYNNALFPNRPPLRGA
jgi:hypothetical protein